MSEKQSQIIGRGYDITGRYAMSDEVKLPVLDFDRMDAAKLIEKDVNIPSSDFNTLCGSTATSFATSMLSNAKINMRAGLGALGGFQAELTSKYSQQRYKSDAYSFAITINKIFKEAYRAANRSRPETLPEYASKEFLRDLDSKTPAEIIRLYGTHVMLGGIWGARLDYKFSAKKTAEAYKKDAASAFSAKANASCLLISSSKQVDKSINDAYSKNYDASTEETHTYAQGGRPEYAQSVHQYQDYTKWINSITNDNSVWIDYYNDSLLPIYEAVSNSAKKAAIRQAFTQYLEGKQITVTSALKQKTVDRPFDLIGGSHVGGDDADINTQSNRQTQWSLEVSLQKVSPGLARANFNYWLKEVAKNYTELRMIKSVDIPIQEQDFVLEGPTTWYSGTGSISGKHHEEIRVSSIHSSLPPFLLRDNLYITIDSPTNKDQNTMRVRGTLKIPYSYVV